MKSLNYSFYEHPKNVVKVDALGVDPNGARMVQLHLHDGLKVIAEQIESSVSGIRYILAHNSDAEVVLVYLPNKDEFVTWLTHDGKSFSNGNYYWNFDEAWEGFELRVFNKLCQKGLI